MFHSGLTAYFHRLIGAMMMAIGLLAAASTAKADPVRIVAIGASNTVGKYSEGQGWANQLEAMLKARGYDVAITNMGVVGDTSAGILSRVGSIPAGTQVVLYDVGGGNDKDKGAAGSTAGNKTAIAQRIRAMGAKPILVSYPSLVGPEGSGGWRQGDPHHHITTQAHARVAAALLPQVMAAIGKRK
jgi:acyl-CoA thioesterase-1